MLERQPDSPQIEEREKNFEGDERVHFDVVTAGRPVLRAGGNAVFRRAFERAPATRPDLPRGAKRVEHETCAERGERNHVWQQCDPAFA